jgi:allophanate hydrolase subunit 1
MGKKKKEKVINLKPEKISDEQLKSVQNIVSAINKLHADIGKLEAQKHNVLHTLAQGNDRLNAVQEEMRKEYGDIDINIQTGTIRYKEDEPSDS